MEPRVLAAGASDAAGIGRALTRALADDPFVRWVVDGTDERARRRYVDLVLRRLTLPHGHVFTTPRHEGASLWVPPGSWDLGWVEQVRLLPAVARVVGLSRLMRVAEASDVIERSRMAAPHYYLALLGTVPEARGRGVARALLAPVLRRCDAEGVPAALETSVPANVPFYARFGFEGETPDLR